jgi:hypothetical protein
MSDLRGSRFLRCPKRIQTVSGSEKIIFLYGTKRDKAGQPQLATNLAFKDPLEDHPGLLKVRTLAQVFVDGNIKMPFAATWDSKWRTLHPARDFKERSPYRRTVSLIVFCARNFECCAETGM